MADLGRCFGAGLYEREVEWFVTREWTHTSDDVLWRRTKAGLRLNGGRRASLEEFLVRRG